MQGEDKEAEGEGAPLPETVILNPRKEKIKGKVWKE
jgi:hypothetical protein